MIVEGTLATLKGSTVIAVVLLTSALSLFFDTLGWWSYLRRLTIVSFSRVSLWIVASEAPARSIPLGVAIADSLKAVLLKKQSGVQMSSGLAAAIIRRWFLGMSQAIYLILGAAALIIIPPVEGAPWFHHSAVQWSLVLPPVLLMAILLVPFSPHVRTWGSRLLGAVQWVATRMTRKWLAEGREHLEHLADVLRDVRSGSKQDFLRSLFSYGGLWLTEALETFLLLWVLGYSVGTFTAFSAETVVSGLRLAAFFLPSGIGVQEIGYASVLSMFGIVASPTDVTSFLLLKRGRDIVLIAAGYALLFALGIKHIHPLREPEAST